MRKIGVPIWEVVDWIVGSIGGRTAFRRGIPPLKQISAHSNSNKDSFRLNGHCCRWGRRQLNHITMIIHDNKRCNYDDRNPMGWLPLDGHCLGDKYDPEADAATIIIYLGDAFATEL